MEKAGAYGAQAVFSKQPEGRAPVAQAFVFVSDGPADDQEFAELHRRLWCWGGVPFIYRKTPGLVQLFRCAHKPDFISAKGETICNPIKNLKMATAINEDPWGMRHGCAMAPYGMIRRFAKKCCQPATPLKRV